jgi:hypothetical protein
VPLIHALKTILMLTAVLLWAVSTGGQLTRDEIHSAVTGKWQVTDVLCPTCTPHVRSEVGATIELSDTKITNAFGGDCTDTPGYALLRKTTTDKLLATKGKAWPGQLRRTLREQKSVIYGYVTCGGGNHMRMIFTTDGPAYYFWEGDTVFVLNRQ